MISLNAKCMTVVSVHSDEKPQDMSLSISTNGNASITVSVEVNGTVYTGVSGLLFATVILVMVSL